ncbi:Wadjet anti-phage system protein JetD domain-containing protein [Georgenia sp. SUBG003]
MLYWGDIDAAGFEIVNQCGTPRTP